MESSAHLLDPKTSRWPGLVLSLLVPGFGLIRAGLLRRGLLWLLASHLASIGFALVLGLDVFPIAVACVLLLPLLGMQSWLLYDSFRPGRMSARGWMLFAALLAAAVLLPEPTGRIVSSFRISTGAMEPTLRGSREGGTPDHLLVDRFTYHFRKPRRGELVVFETSSIDGITKYDETGESYFVKRLVGLPGERIEIRDGSVYADDRQLTEAEGIPAIQYEFGPTLAVPVRRNGKAYLLGEGQYFVLGDNTSNSFDSRYWGFVPEATIFGKVAKIYFPFYRMGKPEYREGVREEVP